MRDYELTFIIQPDLEDEDRSTLVEQVHDWIATAGGSVIKADHWGQRRLAYPIQKIRHGYYVLMHIHIDGDQIRELERRMQISEQILRYLTVRKED